MTEPPQRELIYYAQVLPRNLKTLYLEGLSDWHKGNPYCSEKHITKQLDLLKSPQYYAVINGDLAECVTPDSKGDIWEQVGNAKTQKKWLKDKLTPYKKKILGATCGNHELRVYQKTGIDILEEICEELGIPYRRDGMLLKVSFGQGNDRHPECHYTYWVYFSHGYGGARTSGAKLAKIERLSSFIHSDIYMVSHDHVEQCQPISYLMPDPRTHEEGGFRVGRVREHRKLLVKTGATLKWGGYAERHGFSPSQLGTPLLKLSGEGEPWITVTL